MRVLDFFCIVVLVRREINQGEELLMDIYEPLEVKDMENLYHTDSEYDEREEERNEY